MRTHGRHPVVEGQAGRGRSPPRKWYLASSPSPLRYSRGRQRGQHLGVAQHGGRLPERADEVLALGQVDPGLAADGRVDLAQQRGGHVHDGHAPVVDGGGEPGHVGDHAAAHAPPRSRPG